MLIKPGKCKKSFKGEEEWKNDIAMGSFFEGSKKRRIIIE